MNNQSFCFIAKDLSMYERFQYSSLFSFLEDNKLRASDK
jgi:hypothetical protein